MARKTIFELYQQNNDRERDYARIVSLVRSNKCVVKRSDSNTGWPLKHMFEVGFREWKQRGRCISLEDYLQTIDFESIKICAGAFTDNFLTYIEVI